MSLTAPPCRSDAACYELRFEDLFHPGRGFAFPCDADGHVDMDALSERGRHNYLFARAVVGRDLALPVTHAVPLASAPWSAACHGSGHDSIA
jgi:hypothetical protein